MAWREGGMVLVTGGSSGLGRAIVTTVAKGGGRPVVLDVNRPDDDVDHVLVDLADGRAAEAAVQRATMDVGAVSAVVTAAGIDACGSLEKVSAEQWERVVRVNLLGTAAVIRSALPLLRADGDGRIVTIASTLGLRALPEATAYCASKFGVVGLTRALAAELAGDVGVTLLVPGGMQTPFFDDRPEQYRPPSTAQLNRPEDVAAAVVFALDQPHGCQIRELVVCPSNETSWP